MSTTKTRSALSCIDRPLSERPLIDHSDSAQLVVLFKVLANPTRLRLLHALIRAEELRVSDLADEIGASPQATSNQLQRLVDQHIVAAKRDGNEVRYRVIDPCTPGLIDLAMCLVAQQR